MGHVQQRGWEAWRAAGSTLRAGECAAGQSGKFAVHAEYIGPVPCQGGACKKQRVKRYHSLRLNWLAVLTRSLYRGTPWCYGEMFLEARACQTLLPADTCNAKARCLLFATHIIRAGDLSEVLGHLAH